MFRPNVKLVLEPGAGARIVDDLSRRTLSLTPTEGRILALLAPGSTAESLASAAKGAGIDIEAKQVEALLSRLHANELIDYTPPPASKSAQVALLPDDVVPGFRSDLNVGSAPKPGLMLVTDKTRDRSFTLYDFEVHIARLLDGKKTVSQVIELAGKIGIPVTPESLSKFIGQMKAYGFISDEPVAPAAAPPPAEDHTWPARSNWSGEIRELYQSALRQFRLGRPGHALEYLDALLEIQPDAPEAIELKSRVEAHLDHGPVMEVSFEDLHGEDEPMPSLIAASEPLMGGSGEHKALKGPVWEPKPSAPKPKGPIWSPPAKTGEVAAVPEPIPSAPSSPIWESPAKTGEVPAVKPKGPIWSPPVKTGEQPAVTDPKAPIWESPPNTGEVPAAPRAPIYGAPLKTGEQPAVKPSAPRGPIWSPPAKTGEQPAVKPAAAASSLLEPEPLQIAVGPRPSAGAPAPADRALFAKTVIAPASAPRPDAAALAKTVISRPSSPVLPAAESWSAEEKEKPLPPPPSTSKETVVARPSPGRFPPRTGEVPALKPEPVSEPAPPLKAEDVPAVSDLGTSPVEPSRAHAVSDLETKPETSDSPWGEGEHTTLEPPKKSPFVTGEHTALEPPKKSPFVTGEHTALEPPKKSPFVTGEHTALERPGNRVTAEHAAVPPGLARKTGEHSALGTAPVEPSSARKATLATAPMAQAAPPVEAPVEEKPPEKPLATEPPGLTRKTGEQPAPAPEPAAPEAEEPEHEEATIVGARPTAEQPVARATGEQPALEPRATGKQPALTESPSTKTRPTRTGEIPVLNPVSEEEAAKKRPTRTGDVPALEPRPPRSSRPTAPQSPLESPPTEVLQKELEDDPPARMPERTVVGPAPEAPPARSSAPRPRPSRPEAATDTSQEAAPRRSSTGQRPAVKTDEAPKRTGLFVGIGVLVVLAGLAFPIPAVSKVDVQLVATAKAIPKMPGGVFGKLEVQNGARVDENAVLASLDVSKQKAEKEELTKTAARLDASAQKTLAKANPALLKKAKLAAAKARADLAKAKAGLAKAKDKQKAELDISRKEAAVEKADRFVVAADMTEKAKALKLEATATKEKMAKLQTDIDRAVVTSPASGVFELDTLPPAGAQFDEGTAFGRIVDSALVIQGAPADAKDPVLLAGDRRMPLFGVDKKAEGLTVPFENGVKPGPAQLEISKGYRPWPMVLLAR